MSSSVCPEMSHASMCNAPVFPRWAPPSLSSPQLSPPHAHSLAEVTSTPNTPPQVLGLLAPRGFGQRLGGSQRQGLVHHRGVRQGVDPAPHRPELRPSEG